MFKKTGAIVLALVIVCLSIPAVGNETAESYFPATPGSYWVYEDQDENELTRRAVDAEEIAGEMYHAFEYEPAFENWEKYEYYIHPTLFRVDENGIKFHVGDTVKKAYKKRLTKELEDSLEKSRQNMPPEAQFQPNFDIEIECQEVFYMLPFPATLNEEWETMRIKPTIKINVSFADPANDPEIAGYSTASIIYFTIMETGIILAKESVETAAGKFEDCLKVEYRTETVMPKMQGGDGPEAGESITTLWLAPNVGIVKFRKESEVPLLSDFGNSESTTQVKTFELKKYEIKANSSE